MANYDSSLYTQQAAALTDYSQAPNIKSHGGNLNILHAKVTVNGALSAANDVLRLGYLPPTAKVIPALCRVQHGSNPSSAISLNVGTSATADAFAKNISIPTNNLAGVAFDSGNNALAQVVTPAKLTAPTEVRAKVFSDVTLTGPVTLTFFIAYTLG